MFHIGSSHPPEDDLSEFIAQIEHEERTTLRQEAMAEIAREKDDAFVILILSEEWIDVLRANVN